jgi:CheY-like chemotaxis protein
MDNLILVLDDSQERQEKFWQKLDNQKVSNDVYYAETAKHAIELLQLYIFDWAFLDHDLGGKVMVESVENTGYEVALWLSKNQDRMPKNIVIHSLNPEGAKRIKGVLPQAQVLPCAWGYL